MQLGRLPDSMRSKVDFTVRDLWSFDDPPARLVHVNTKGNAITAAEETKLLFTHIQIAADRKSTKLVKAEADIRAVATRADMQPVKRAVQLTKLGLQDDIIEELTSSVGHRTAIFQLGSECPVLRGRASV